MTREEAFDRFWKPTEHVTGALENAFREVFYAGWHAGRRNFYPTQADYTGGDDLPPCPDDPDGLHHTGCGCE